MNDKGKAYPLRTSTWDQTMICFNEYLKQNAFQFIFGGFSDQICTSEQLYKIQIGKDNWDFQMAS